MSVQFKNNSVTALAFDIDENDQNIEVLTGTGGNLPVLAAGEYFYATLEDFEGYTEIVKVITTTDDILTVERGAENTIPRPFIAGSLIENRFTAQTLRDIVDRDYLLL